MRSIRSEVPQLNTEMNSKTSKKRKQYTNATGRVSEIRFLRAAEALGLTLVKSTQLEDRQQHVDFWMSLDGKGKWGVDVKGNNMPDEIWVEFKNVMGDIGWLYGDAKIIAFEMPEAGGFAVVDREELAFFCEKHVRRVAAQSKDDSYLKLYTRRDRKDVITKLYLSDIQSLRSYRVWKYFNDYR
jgi:hypothetical protein